MAQHHIDWSKLNVPVEGVPVNGSDYVSSLISALPEQTITVEGLYADWPVGEEIHVDWYGDGTVTCDTVVTRVEDDGTWTLSVQ